MGPEYQGKYQRKQKKVHPTMQWASYLVKPASFPISQPSLNESGMASKIKKKHKNLATITALSKQRTCISQPTRSGRKQSHFSAPGEERRNKMREKARHSANNCAQQFSHHQQHGLHNTDRQASWHAAFFNLQRHLRPLRNKDGSTAKMAPMS